MERQRYKPKFADKDGNPINSQQWSILQQDDDYKIIKQETHEIDGVSYFISTVWLGLDHAFFPSPDLHIFETMVFSPDNQVTDYYMERYSTLQQAIDGHQKVVEKVLSGKITEEGEE